MNEATLRTFERLVELLEEVKHVHLPDYLQTLSEDPEPYPDWDLLYLLRGAQKACQAMALDVASANRAIIENAWVGGPEPGAPPEAGPLPLLGG